MWLCYIVPVNLDNHQYPSTLGGNKINSHVCEETEVLLLLLLLLLLLHLLLILPLLLLLLILIIILLLLLLPLLFLFLHLHLYSVYQNLELGTEEQMDGQTDIRMEKLYLERSS